MAVATQEKGRGLRFAEQQMLRHGWEQGKGLGKDENGISEAIKVKVKCDKGGVGHKESEQFTFHWWDHVFNKASSGLAVESEQDGVVVKKIQGEEEEGMISNKKPRKAKLNKAALYGCFVKSATLLSGQEHPEHRSSGSEDSSSSEDEEKLDLSSTTKLSDEALIKACGGRTAHKGARHGLTMSAKLARLEQQEQEFMAKYGKKNQKAKSTPQSEDTPCSSETSSTVDQEIVIKTKPKKPKKKERGLEELSKNRAQEDEPKIDIAQICHNETSKKQNKRSKEQPPDTSDALLDSSETFSTEKKKKKKRRDIEKVLAAEEGVNGSAVLEEDSKESFQQLEETGADETDRTSVHPLEGDSVSRREKRKKKKQSKKMAALEEGQDNVAAEDCKDNQESNGQEEQEDCSVRKKKKKKSSKELEPSHVLQSSVAELSTNAEGTVKTAGEREELESKKRKRCREGDYEGVVENGLADELSGKKKKKKNKK